MDDAAIQRKLLWRARREERREKQRAANVGRAGKMHLARVEWEKENEPRIVNPAAGIYVGCSGWFYWHWRGGFYPQELSGSKWFGHYAKSFRTVELNAPFYSWPTVGTVKTWMRQAGRKRFVYTVKVCELITHVKRFSRTKELVRDFGWIADVLGERMGCFLFQMPPSFRYTAARLKRVVEQMDSKRLNVLEFRHKSWWNEKVYEACREAGVIFCSCSGPRLPDELVKTGEDVYIRFHGTTRWYRHDYSKEELEVWASRIRACGAKRVWAYFNNDREGYAIKNARMLIRMLRNK